MPMDAESRRLIDWMEKGMLIYHFICWDLWFVQFLCSQASRHIFVGVYDALRKKYLKTLLFCICEAIDGAIIEEYACKIYKLIIGCKALVSFDIVNLQFAVQTPKITVNIHRNEPVVFAFIRLHPEFISY